MMRMGQGHHSRRSKSANCQIIYSSVHQTPAWLTEKDHSIDAASFFENKKLKDMPVHYAETARLDRIICAHALYHQDMGVKVIIDMGTFTTIDWLSAEGFLGGYILPGVQLLKENYSRGKQLFEAGPEWSPNLPQDSQYAISRGLHQVINAPILSLLEQHEFDEIFLTGGASQAFSKLGIGKKINEEKDLIHLGLKIFFFEE